MREASGVVWGTFREWYDSMLGLALFNLLWVGLSLTIVLFPPATAALYGVTHTIARGKGQRPADFFDHFRRYAWISFRWAALNGIVAVFAAVDLAFYGSTGGLAGMMVQALVGSGVLLWIATQFYVWPFIYEQEDRRLRVALKNALFLALATPLYTATLLGTLALVTAISVALVLPLAAFWMSFVSLLGHRAAIERLRAFGKLPQPPPVATEEDV